MTGRGITDEVRQELAELQQQHGLLKPEHVVERAKDVTSALHSHFDWDNDVAGHKWRLEQASDLIVRVKIEYEVGEERTVRVRLYHSLPTDRVSGGGYRPIDAVMSEPQKRAELLKTALQELRALKRRYEMLSELAEVFAALDEADQGGEAA